MTPLRAGSVMRCPRRLVALALATLALAPALAQATPGGRMPPRPRVRATGARRDRPSPQLNGPALNGTRLDADPASPRALDHADLRAGLTLPFGLQLHGVRFDAGRLVAARAPDLTGALLSAVATDGRAVRLRIDAVVPAPDPDPLTAGNEAAGLTAYRLSFQEGARNRAGAFIPAGDFTPLCGGEPAVAVPGRWDYGRGHPGDGRRLSEGLDVITFACASAPIGRCALLGYHPWAPSTKADHLPLAELHQICTRALRADYCGTGEGASDERARINLWDSAGIRRKALDGTPEAVWDQTGARCVQQPRLETLPGDARTFVTAWIGRTCPQILKALCIIELPASRPTIWSEQR